IGFRVIKPDALVLDRDGDTNSKDRALVPAVVIDPAFAAVDTVGDGRDLTFHHLARRIEQRLLVRFEARTAILLEERQHSALADTARADLRLHVVLHDIEADVGEDQVPYILAQSSLLVDLHRRNAQR